MEKTVDIFILTRESFDTDNGHILRYYGRSSESSVLVEIDNFPPRFYISPQKTKIGPFTHKREKTEMRDFEGKLVDRVWFMKYWDMKTAGDLLRDKEVPVFEDDLRTEDLYLMENQINSTMRVSGPCRQKDGRLYFKNPKIEPVDFDPDLRVASIDIETNSRNEQIYSVACHVWDSKSSDSIVFMIGPVEESSGNLFFVEDEAALMLAFFEWFNQMDPDIIIGWFVIGFDLKRISDKCDHLGIKMDLSRGRGRSSLYQKKRRKGVGIRISGRVVLDGPQLLRASFIRFPDYKLETVARAVLGKGKLIKGTHDKGNVINRMFIHDKRGLAKYNLLDCVLVSEIFQKTRILDLATTRSKLNGLPLDRSSATIAAFEHFYLGPFHRAGFVTRNVKDIKKTRRNKGGYVMDPQTGLYDNVIALDFKSLYPSIVRSFRIDPLSVLLGDIDPLTTPNGLVVSRTNCQLDSLFERLMDKRQEAKDGKHNLLSKALKIHMNGFYGSMGSEGCRFFNQDLAEGIVGNANWVLLESKEWLESNGYPVLYGDTDSLFVKLKTGEDPEAGFRIAKDLNEYWITRLRDEFNLQSCLEIEFEKFFIKFVLPLSRRGRGSAKKRYAGLVVTKTGTRVDFVGLESVRSDWTQLAKKFQLGLYGRVFRGKDYQEYVRKFVWDLAHGEKDSQLIYSKRLRRDLSRYKVNPPHVKAAKMLSYPPSTIEYLMTPSGPVPIQLDPQEIDYDHYIKKQLEPIADAILGVLGTSFKDVVFGEQMTLF